MKTIFKDYLYGLAIISFVIFCASLAYFISVNTILKNFVSPSVKGEGMSARFKLQENQDLKIMYMGNEHILPVKEINVESVISKILPESNIGVNEQNNLSLVRKCQDENMILEIDTKRIDELIGSALEDDLTVEIRSQDLFVRDEMAQDFEKCVIYEADIFDLNRAVAHLEVGRNASVDELFELRLNESQEFEWVVNNEGLLKAVFEDYREANATEPYGGEYEIVEGKLLLLKNFNLGKQLNVEGSYNAILEWLEDPEGFFPLKYKMTTWQEPVGYEILDFTKLVGSGKTRVDIIRNGGLNEGVFFAQAGVEDMHNRIILPGEEFSYIGAINPQPNGQMESGRYIGWGICNATTTLFRAAIEAGLPILERQNHTWSVESYKWGYPVNLVDAAYYTSPEVDLVFKNDMNYPIILRSKIERKNDGFQYHTISVYTSSHAPTRTVELTNWKIWDVYSEWAYKGSFDRYVSVKGKVIRKDTFQSHYH